VRYSRSDFAARQPIVSTANVAQLAADLLIASLDLKCVGLFDARYLVPAIGPRDDGDGVTTALECVCPRRWISVSELTFLPVYGREGIDVVVMQPRSPVLKASALRVRRVQKLIVK
jgi:proteasome assembly chaperone 2